MYVHFLNNNMKKSKTIYIGLSADGIHHGHIKLLEKARDYGEIIVGLLTDEAIATYKRIPYLKYEQREQILLNLKGVKKVVPQNKQDYSYNIKMIKPDFMIHGDDWKVGYMKEFRKNCIKALNSYGGKLIEVPYTKGISSSAFINHLDSTSITADIRRGTLRRLVESKKLSRFIESHSPISAIIAETAFVKKNGKKIGFDGFWSSSLTDSTALGKPDNESLSYTQRMSAIDHIFDVTTKPLIFDGDTGGQIEHLDMKIKTMERLGISAVIFEDKTGLKQNSLFENTSNQKQEDRIIFGKKLNTAKKAQRSEEFMVIARIESFILGSGLDDALIRAKTYVDSGSDGIMIHSKSNSPKEIFIFSEKFKKIYPNTPLVCVPSTYNQVKENELENNGFNIVIYANHMLRAAYPAMKKVALKILKNGRSKEANNDLQSIKEILELIPGTK